MPSDYNFAAMPIDTLWRLYEELRVVLAAKINEQRQELDARLHDLEQIAPLPSQSMLALRPFAGPVYRNPEQPSQIWSGRGLRPRWLVLQLAAGRKLDEFRVKPAIPDPSQPQDQASSLTR